MNDVLNWLHWIIFAIGCLAIFGTIVFLTVIKWDSAKQPLSEEEQTRRERMLE